MDLSRFHSAIEKIAGDYSRNQINTHLTSLVTNLNSLAANPGNASISQAFKDQLNVLSNVLGESSLNFAEGELSQTLDNQNLNEYVGDGLFRNIRKVLEENQLTPNLAASAIEKLRLETEVKLAAVIAINKAFTELEVDYWTLDEGLAEILISIPIEEETKTLDDLAKETKDWHRICDVISETFDPDRSPVTVRSVSSGSVLLYLAAVPVFIAGIARCLKGVNLILSEMIKAKDLYKQLIDSKVPEEISKKLELHNTTKAKTDLEELAKRLVDEYYKGADEGRKNELTTSLSMSLQRLAQKLAAGATVNLRLAPPKKPKITEGEEPTEEQKAVLEKIEQFEKIQIEVDSSKSALDYKKHSEELIAALPAPASVVEKV